MSSDDKLAKLNDAATAAAYKLRLQMLSPSKRILAKNGIEDNQGFLTPAGAMIYLDYLWQNDPKAQEAIANQLKDADKENKKG